MGWEELRNGELLREAENGGIDVFLTGDRSLIHGQNLAGRRLSLVVLSTNNWRIMKEHAPLVLLAINNARVGSLQSVECGRFSRKHR